MAKILISWMAFENDFVKGKAVVNLDGPNCSVHRFFFDYDYHVLLTASSVAENDTKYQFLVAQLRGAYGHNIEERAMSIIDIIDIEEISAKVNALLLSYKNDEIDIFISPGTPTMQVAWYLAHQSLGIKTKLFQLRKAEHSKNKQPEQLWVTLTKSTYTASLIIKQIGLDDKTEHRNQIILGSLKEVYKRAEKIALADHVRILITGETGTGKELLARHVHINSPRAKARFQAINCSALGNDLLESRLFGYMKGAFTGANEDTPGLFHELNGGTIFLDEIGDITPYMQQTLLRVIQEGEILRVGSKKTEKVDVRIISATNRDLYEMCTKNLYRGDLYYRLAVTELNLPSLKEYASKEKEQIFDFLWKKSMLKFNKHEPKLNKLIKNSILQYLFPGNIREMENIVDGIIAEADEEVKHENLPKRILQPPIEHSLKLIDVERRHIQKVYEMCNQNGQVACKLLGIKSYNTLKSKLASYSNSLRGK
jgi:transcriptional regulator with PAS, ATPase and Fis domain